MTFDRAFREVMNRCASVPRREGEGTWIVPDMVDAYCRLHRMGYAHSVEAWHGGELAGGLYGVSIGRVFYGESMFAQKTDASKVALVHLVSLLRRTGFELVDCQVTTGHLMSMGAREIARREFLARLARALRNPAPTSAWSLDGLLDPAW